ncbi:tRNA 2-thiouridine synthesizing protein A [Devosia lucknowensis]|uniref:tRNA 2-thiouridine synthesizing protein A n=1 Tax=Devosia lucknowensis TaxID=1096929 RepID=A0A1Y6EMM7_9HYPH|nr:sulfurtransferase TusA family protein [Devosia lucknowensis]SMQ63914.1 tRNA 2-thiouridine synthesizing protein A [Devosia lucknowensis]
MATDADVIDARGLKCPLPVLKLEKRLAQVAEGTAITVLVTDPMAKIDIPLHCRQNGHAYSQDDGPDGMRFMVTKGAA